MARVLDDKSEVMLGCKPDCLLNVRNIGSIDSEERNSTLATRWTHETSGAQTTVTIVCFPIGVSHGTRLKLAPALLEIALLDLLVLSGVIEGVVACARRGCCCNKAATNSRTEGLPCVCRGPAGLIGETATTSARKSVAARYCDDINWWSANNMWRAYEKERNEGNSR